MTSLTLGRDGRTYYDQSGRPSASWDGGQIRFNSFDNRDAGLSRDVRDYLAVRPYALKDLKYEAGLRQRLDDRNRSWQSRENALNRGADRSNLMAQLSAQERMEGLRQGAAERIATRGQDMDYRIAELNDTGATRRANIDASARIATANISAGAQKYSSDKDLEGRQYSSDRSLQGQMLASMSDLAGRKYASDLQYKGQIESANIGRLAEQDRSVLTGVASMYGQNNALLQSYLDAGRAQAPSVNILSSLFGR